MRFRTRVIHDGQPIDPADGCGQPADLPRRAPSGRVRPTSTRGTCTAGPGTRPERSSRPPSAPSKGERGASRSPPGWGRSTTLLESLPSGSRIVAVDDLYGGTWRLFEHHRRQFGLEVEYVDLADPASSRRRAHARRPTSCTSRPPRTRCSTWSTFGRRSGRLGQVGARGRSSTIPSPRPPCSARSSSARTSSCTRRRSTSAGTPTSSGGPWSSALGRRWPRLRLAAERGRRGPEPVRLLPRPPRNPHPGSPDAGPRRERPGRGGGAGGPPEGADGPLSRARPPTPNTRSPADRWTATAASSSVDLRTRTARRAAVPEGALDLHPRREPRRRRVAGRPSGDHDARQRSPTPSARPTAITDGLLRLSCGIEDPADLADDVRQALRRV